MKLIISLAAFLFLIIPRLAFAETSATEAARPQQPASQAMDEAKKMLGTVPLMFSLIPESTQASAWEEFKNLQLSQTTAIPGKYKELIGAAVAAQIPCSYCEYFHTHASMDVGGATKGEVQEAIAIAADTRRWSTFFNGIPQDMNTFKRDLNTIFNKKHTAPPSGGLALNQQDVYKEAKRMYGMVPLFLRQYPQEAVAGAWNYMKQLNMAATAIPAKYKSLVSLAVSAQVPCSYCVEFDTRAAKAAGATGREIAEAVALAGETRNWSTVLNGNLVNEAEFKANTDQIISFVKSQQAPAVRSSTTAPAPDSSGDIE